MPLAFASEFFFARSPVDGGAEDVLVPEDEGGRVRGRLRRQLARDLRRVAHYGQDRALGHCGECTTLSNIQAT